MMPVFPIKLVLLIVLVVIAGTIMGIGSARGGGFLKKQPVAWGLTALMIFAAIGIGYAKAPINNIPAPEPDLPQAYPALSFVRDEANVLSGKTVKTLDQRNERLWDRYSATIGVVTCDDAEDLGEYAMKCAEAMGLGGYDFIVALDISDENYWLIQGNDIRRAFTDDDCADYACDYMEDYFARGMYDDAVLDLTEALEAWYGNCYG